MYKLTKNGIYAGDFNDLSTAQIRAQALENHAMTFQGEEDYWFAFGPGKKRNEYEINLVKKKRA